MRDFEYYLLEQIKRHPSMQPQDILKQCYQAAFGAEHILQDKERAKQYIKEEYDRVRANDIPLYEPISAHICRVNLAAWKYHRLPVSWLFPMIASSPFKGEEGNGVFEKYLQTAEGKLTVASVTFSVSDWKEYLTTYKKEGLRPVHHSPQYRDKEQPAYRIVDKKFVFFFPLLKLFGKARNIGRSV